MSLQKTPIDINFAKGLDTKTDANRVAIGNFLSLTNTIFDKVGRLTKRNGFGALTPLPDATSIYATTFNNSLLAIGDELESYNANTSTWVNKGTIQRCSLNTLSLIRSGTNQSQVDSAVASNGLVCVAYIDQNVLALSQPQVKYAVFDSNTGECVVNPVVLTTNATNGSPRVFIIGGYFIIVFTSILSSTVHLQYVAVSTSNPAAGATIPVNVASPYVSASTVSWDGVVANNNLYIAYNTTTGGQSINVTYISTALGNPVGLTSFVGYAATMMSLTVDTYNPSVPIIWISFYSPSAAYTTAVYSNLTPVSALATPIETLSGLTILNITSTAYNGLNTIYYEVSNNYSFDSSLPTHYINTSTCTIGGVTTAYSQFIRSVGLASKAFLLNNSSYVLVAYSSVNQPSYFLLNSQAQVICKLAYSNGGGYLTLGLPSVTIQDETVFIPYLIKDDLVSVNKTQGSDVSAPFYTQTGINLASFNLDPSVITASEIGANTNISGGFVMAYDGFSATEQNFFLWPDMDTSLSSSTGIGTSKAVTVSNSGGSITTQDYYYTVTYEWTDNQGNLFRSAPSIPIPVDASNFSGSSNSVTINIPTLRLTYKLKNPVTLVIYRWSQAQQVYYQLPLIQTPILNNPNVDSIAFTDTFNDASIIGDTILYTTGGVVEDISPPATDNIALFNNRLWLVDAEDRNLLWFSKQVIENTPVEMSDLLTLYVAPTTASQGSTGPITAIAPMDDKLIVFKETASGYINGMGPDNTGANNQYSDFTLINSTVGCTNQQSIVFMPLGLMFQSNKGIWLLGRDLSTQYIGAPVEAFNSNTVTSAVTIPGTNQVRFTLDNGMALMYDYYVGQWTSFSNLSAVSSTIYNDLHTYITDNGDVLQETPSIYLDFTTPVLISLTTSWISLAGVQGFERLYELLLLGQSITPFTLSVNIAYNFNPAAQTFATVSPLPPVGNFGTDTIYGSTTPFGGESQAFKARVFPSIQKCESFQLQISENYNATYGIQAGAGLTLTGLNLLVGAKKAHRTSSASRSFG